MGNGTRTRSLSRKSAFQIALLVSAGLGLSLVLRAQAPVGQNVADNPTAQAILMDRRSPVAEAANADLTLVAFTDYRCPACRKAHPELQRAVTDDGRTRVVYKDWPIFGPASERAARVAIASNLQGIYPRVHNALMRAERFDEQELRRIVVSSGGSWERLVADLSNHRVAIEGQLENNRQQAFALGLEGTPGYLVGSILVRGAASERQFRQAIVEGRRQQRS
jgi:protein-disulfide isomerase